MQRAPNRPNPVFAFFSLCFGRDGGRWRFGEHKHMCLKSIVTCDTMVFAILSPCPILAVHEEGRKERGRSHLNCVALRCAAAAAAFPERPRLHQTERYGGLCFNPSFETARRRVRSNNFQATSCAVGWKWRSAETNRTLRISDGWSLGV
jgi:hypothetical protein